MTPITSEELRAWRELCERATPGPWEVVKVKTLMFANNGSGLHIATTASNIPVFTTCIKRCETVSDLELCAKAREALPRCIAFIDEQAAEIDRLNRVIESLTTSHRNAK